MKTTKTPQRSRVFVTISMATAIVLTLAMTAWASHAHLEITVPLDTNFGAPEGSVTELGTAVVPDDFVGHECEVKAHSQNQNSVHPGNDILVKSGTSQVTLADVEAEPGKVTAADQMLELGAVITVSLKMGPTEGFSAGIDVVVECHEEEPEVEPTVVTTSTTEVVTPTEDTTPTQPDVTEATQPTDKVKGTEVLPFTGPEDSRLGLVAVALVAGGTLLVVGTRRRED